MLKIINIRIKIKVFHQYIDEKHNFVSLKYNKPYGYKKQPYQILK